MTDDYSKINTFLALTINLSGILNPFEVLKENHVVPSAGTTYDIASILAAFTRHHNGDDSVMPVCLAEKSSRVIYLAELRFCLDLNFLPIRCNPGEMSR